MLNEPQTVSLATNNVIGTGLDLETSANCGNFESTKHSISMKKTLFLCSMLVCLFLTSTKVYGQITISNVESRDKIIAFDPFNFCGIGLDDNGYYLFSNTSNMFDGQFILYLGEEKDGSLKTITDLVVLVDVVKTQNITFQSWNGNSYTASMVHDGIALSSPDHAGKVYLHKSLLNWLIGQLENPQGGPWDSINDASNAVGSSEQATSVVWGGQMRKWGDTYYLSLSTGVFYLGSSKEDAIETLREYTTMMSSNEQVWPIIILKSTLCARVSNLIELGARTAYVYPMDDSPKLTLYQLYMKKHLSALDR